MDAEPLTISVEQAAELLDVGKTAIYRGVASGEIDHIRCGRAIRICYGALLRKCQGSAGSLDPEEVDAIAQRVAGIVVDAFVARLATCFDTPAAQATQHERGSVRKVG